MATDIRQSDRLLHWLLAFGTFVALPLGLACMIVGSRMHSEPTAIAAIMIFAGGAIVGGLRGSLPFRESEDGGALLPLLVFLALTANIMVGILAVIAWQTITS